MPDIRCGAFGYTPRRAIGQAQNNFILSLSETPLWFPVWPVCTHTLVQRSSFPHSSLECGVRFLDARDSDYGEPKPQGNFNLHLFIDWQYWRHFKTVTDYLCFFWELPAHSFCWLTSLFFLPLCLIFAGLNTFWILIPRLKYS